MLDLLVIVWCIVGMTGVYYSRVWDDGTAIAVTFIIVSLISVAIDLM